MAEKKPAPKPTPTQPGRMKTKPANFTDSEWANTVSDGRGNRIVESARGSGEWSKAEMASRATLQNELKDRRVKAAARASALSAKAGAFIKKPAAMTSDGKPAKSGDKKPGPYKLKKQEYYQ